MLLVKPSLRNNIINPCYGEVYRSLYRDMAKKGGLVYRWKIPISGGNCIRYG